MITRKHKLGAFFASLFLCALLLLCGEIFCRLFLDINFRRTSREFVVTNAAGTVIANQKNAHGVSFGTDVYSDANGFRINPARAEKIYDQAVLVMGDSVTFGVGVPEEKTYVGLFREKLTDTTVYNSAVVGFSIPDYRRVIDEFIPQHQEIKTVYLFYCLNDFHETAEIDINADDDGTMRTIKLKTAELISSANEFFGAHSKLYVYVTGKIIDPSDKYFRSDLTTYQVDDEKFNRIIQPLADIANELKSRNITFVVFINPYEKQLRTGAEADRLPQAKLENYFAAHHIEYVDTYQNFQGMKSADGFLFEDPAHLSEKGHRIVFDALWQNWQKIKSNAAAN